MFKKYLRSNSRDSFIKALAITLIFFHSAVLAEQIWATAKPAYRKTTITGFSRARHSMVLSTEIAEKVKPVFVDIGDTVPQSRNIACLDDTFVKIDINLMGNEIAQHQIDIDYYQKQVNRYKKLVAKNSAAVSQLDDFQRQLANAQRLTQINKLKKKRLKEQHKRYCIKAPQGWKVIERRVETGQWLNIGDPVAKVGDYRTLLVPLALSVSEMKALEHQQYQLKVNLPEYNQQVPASIERISPSFDEQSRKIQVDLLLEKNLPVHRGGLRVEVNLELPESAGTFFISPKALDKKFEEVWLERKDGTRISVDLLGYTENGLARISSYEIKTGDQFKILQP